MCCLPACLQGSRQAEREGVAIVLIHGFGAGVFCWRHIMEALAMQCHCRVVAFDRPGFGEWQPCLCKPAVLVCHLLTVPHRTASYHMSWQ
jgi:pimeloyl-ACP methyl ester carboxylesterase